MLCGAQQTGLRYAVIFFVCHHACFNPGISGCHLLVVVILCLIRNINAFLLKKKKKKANFTHLRKSPQERWTPILSKILGRKEEKKKRKLFSTGIFFCLLQLNEDNLTQKWLCIQARKWEIEAPTGRRFINSQWKVIFCWNANSLRALFQRHAGWNWPLNTLAY